MVGEHVHARGAIFNEVSSACNSFEFKNILHIPGICRRAIVTNCSMEIGIGPQYNNIGKLPTRVSKFAISLFDSTVAQLYSKF